MFDEARLKCLIDSYFDQQLKPEEKHELETMLLGSSRARELFLEQSEWHGLTREWALREVSLEPVAGESIPQQPTRGDSFKYISWGAAGIAACAMLVWLFLHRLNSPQALPEPEVAVVTTTPKVGRQRVDVALLGQAIGVEWGNETAPLQVGSPLPKGWLHLQKGTLRLDFYSGATVIVDGPASLELISPDVIRLDRGRLTASVPPPAEGFTVLSANLKIVDRSTEFGMKVEGPGDCEVHVFKGEIELHGKVSRELKQGSALAIREGVATSLIANRDGFTDPAALHRVDVLESEARWKDWKESSDTFRVTPGLLVYFDFEEREPGSSLIVNRAAAASPDSFGTVVGCENLSGRWPGKTAIGFTKTSDRIRFRASGQTSSLTLLAWVRVDSLLLEHNSLFTMSTEEVGEIHWKLGQTGRLLLGLRASKELKYSSWERLESPVVVTDRDIGRWMHFATVIDGEKNTIKHYVNGEEAASGRISRPTPVRLGRANLGNFDALPGERSRYGVGRSFNGRIDEFAMINRSLTAEEIAKAAR